MSLHDIFKVHKKTVLFHEGGFQVDCTLKPNKESDTYNLSGFTNFTGATFTKDGEIIFGDTFELTINLDELSEYTERVPSQGWSVLVHFPQINKNVEFLIENAPIDRTLGTCLLRCSAVADKSSSKQVKRVDYGGL